jgi:hypothetical protein
MARKMNTHNNTQVKTHVGTFQVKYHRDGGKVGSTSVIIRKKLVYEPYDILAYKFGAK